MSKCEFKGIKWHDFLELLFESKHPIKSTRNLMNIDVPCGDDHSIACLKENINAVIRNNILHVLADCLKDYQITSDHTIGGQFSNISLSFTTPMSEFKFNY